jgi:hypothetical protein
LLINTLNLKKSIFSFLKNLPGWHTSKRIIVFAVDDYGNIRLDSKAARQKMDAAGIKIQSHFDAYDTLETSQDLQALYEVLQSVKDKNGHTAVFTPYALPCNIDFETVAAENYQSYHYETLDKSFEKLAAIYPHSYTDAWQMWQRGIEMGIFIPQFHGREHLNIQMINEKLQNKDAELLTILKNRSLAGISNNKNSTKSWTAAFSFDTEEDTNHFPEILRTGTEAFHQVFGFQSECFTPPAQHFPPWLEDSLAEYGIKYLDKAFYKKQHLGDGKFKGEINYTGKKIHSKLGVLTRNVVFEPTNGTADHVGNCMKQISAAFAMKKPAIISSHRVNFCGHIDEANRKKRAECFETIIRGNREKMA